MTREIGGPGWLLVAWIFAGVLTIVGALSYGELAAMMPRAGGIYIYLREAFSPVCGLLYGWIVFTVIQTGTIAAVAAAFARFSGVLWPRIAEDNYLIPPIHLSSGYAVSLSTAQLLGVLVIALLTWSNSRGLQYGRIVQNVFTTAKRGGIVGPSCGGLTAGLERHGRRRELWQSLDPARLRGDCPGIGRAVMAIAIMVSTFGCINSLVLVGARASYAMAHDGLFFKSAGVLNQAKVPGWSLMLQGIWAAALVLPWTFDPETGNYGNVYSNLLDYVISAVVIFYVLTIAGVFRLRAIQPHVERAYRVFGHPIVPALYIVGAGAILAILFAHRTATAWPGLIIVLLGMPVYWLLKKSARSHATN